MIERRVAFALLALPFAWVAVQVLTDFPGGEIPVAIVAAIFVGFGVFALERESAFGGRGVAAFLGLIALAGIAFALPGVSVAVVPDVAAGALIGFPWIVIGYVSGPRVPLGNRFIGYGLAVTWGLLLLASAGALRGTTSGTSGTAFVTSFFTIASQQGQVLGGLLTGSTLPPLPVHEVFDLVYVALTGLSIVGLLLLTVRPQTGGEAPLPVEVRTFRETDTERELRRSYGFSAAQQVVYRERSSTESPFLTWPPGLAPVFYGAVAAGAFLVGAYLLPYLAVLAVTAAIGASVLALFILTESPGLLGMEGPPATRTEAPPTPSPTEPEVPATMKPTLSDGSVAPPAGAP